MASFNHITSWLIANVGQGNSPNNVTPQLTQDGAESGGDLLCHSCVLVLAGVLIDDC